MPLGMEVGLGPQATVLDGDPAPPVKMGDIAPFSAHVYCGQTVRWIKMPIGMEVGRLGQGDNLLDGDQAPPEKKGHSLQFSAHVYCGKQLDGSICHLVRR